MNSDIKNLIPDYLQKSLGIQNTTYTCKRLFLPENYEYSNLNYVYSITLDTAGQILVLKIFGDGDIDLFLKESFSSFLQASGAICGIIISDSTVYQIIAKPGKMTEMVNNVQPFRDIYSEEIIIEDPFFVDILDNYLDVIWKQASKVFFQSYGESENDIRTYTILSSVLEALILKMAAYFTDIYQIQEDSLFWQLINLGTEIPKYTHKEKTSVFDLEIRKKMVNTCFAIDVPDKLPLFFVEPLLLTRAIHRLIQKTRSQEKRKKDDPPLIECDNDNLINSPLFHHILQDMVKNRSSEPVLIDPFSGNGELILLLSRFFSEQCSSISSRLHYISSHIYSLDHSLTSVMITRFGLILTIIGRVFLEKSLFEPDYHNFSASIRKHIRVGSWIFNLDLKDEFLSENEKRDAERKYRPFHDNWPDIPQEQYVVLISAPRGNVCLKTPEIRQYLCKNYMSYAQEPVFSFIASERMITKTRFVSYTIIREPWISGENSESFRKWIRKNRVKRIVINDNSDMGYQNSLTCLIADDFKNGITISKIRKNDNINSFFLCRDDLPRKGGWNLEDPFSLQLLELLKKNTIPLSEYCLGALYLPGEIEISGKDDNWISLIPDRNSLNIKSGIKADPKAEIIIRGPDPYLEAILTSSLIQWYWNQNTQIKNGLPSTSMISRIPIIQPDWFDKEEKEFVCQLSDCMRTRSFLLQKMNYTRSQHDLIRIQIQLTNIEKKRDSILFRLYQIPESYHKLFS